MSVFQIRKVSNTNLLNIGNLDTDIRNIRKFVESLSQHSSDIADSITNNTLDIKKAFILNSGELILDQFLEDIHYQRNSLLSKLLVLKNGIIDQILQMRDEHSKLIEYIMGDRQICGHDSAHGQYCAKNIYIQDINYFDVKLIGEYKIYRSGDAHLLKCLPRKVSQFGFEPNLKIFEIVSIHVQVG